MVDAEVVALPVADDSTEGHCDEATDNCDILTEGLGREDNALHRLSRTRD